MLLEVVLALVLFAAAATVIGGAIHSAVEAVQRQKLQVHASNLAATVLTELQLGLRSVATPGPEPFAEPFTDWTWQLALSPREEPLAESSPLTIVEVIVRHEDPPMVYRLAQGLTLPKHAAGAANDSWRTPP